jgi:gamma-glutamyltranspeptidase / glutathione hydrolase
MPDDAGDVEAMNLAEAADIARTGLYSQSPLGLYRLAQINKPCFLLGGGPLVTNAEIRPRLNEFGIDLSLESRLQKVTSRKLWEAMEAGRFPKAGPSTTLPAHSDSVVAIDQWGNIAAVVHSINTVSWGATGIFVDGISIPDSACFQQAAIAAAGPGQRLPDPATPGLVLENGKPYMGFGSIGAGLNIRTVACLLAVLDFGMTPQEAIDLPSIGSFVFGGVDKLAVGKGEFTPEFLQEVSELGQGVVEDDTLRGYWLGIQVDRKSGQLHGGSIRELDLGGRAVGY